MKSFITESIKGLMNLLIGMGVTFKQMFKKPCTIQYPEQRLIWPNRTRGRLVMPLDKTTNKNRCTACMMCQKICPNGSIEISIKTNETGKRTLDRYTHYLDRCTFCGLCVEVCPFDALRMSHEHEIAVRDKKQLIRSLEKEVLYFNDDWEGGLPAKKDQLNTTMEKERS